MLISGYNYGSDVRRRESLRVSYVSRDDDDNDDDGCRERASESSSRARVNAGAAKWLPEEGAGNVVNVVLSMRKRDNDAIKAECHYSQLSSTFTRHALHILLLLLSRLI